LELGVNNSWISNKIQNIKKNIFKHMAWISASCNKLQADLCMGWASLSHVVHGPGQSLKQIRSKWAEQGWKGRAELIIEFKY